MRNFFEAISKNRELSPQEKDKAVLEALGTEVRFSKGYEKLRAVLQLIFSHEDTHNHEQTLEAFKCLEVTDWQLSDDHYHFNALEAQYGFFSEVPEHQKEALFNLFNTLSMTSRALMVLFEDTDALSDDAIIYESAYKLMALYLDPTQDFQDIKIFQHISQQVHACLTQFDIKLTRPFHDAFMVKLNLSAAHTIADRIGWRHLIQQLGIKAFKYFNDAERLEQEIEKIEGVRRAPSNTEEAKNIMARSRYDRAHEDLEFAALCEQYNVDQPTFNACLDYIQAPPGWPKKIEDTLPCDRIQGEGAAEGYTWVKLPPHDKRALILGYITNCCQSIGGHSQSCVKDGVSLKNNGFYILLKQNKSHFKVIGQSYAWRSLTGNLCLDSIECLENNISDTALQALLTQFADKALHEDEQLRFVTVGQGGKTPADLFQTARLPEQIKQGIAYGDATRQYCIKARKTTSLEPLPESMGSEEFLCCMNYLRHYLPEEETSITAIQTLITAHPEVKNYLTRYFTTLLLTISNGNISLKDLEPINFNTLQATNTDTEHTILAKTSPFAPVLHAKTVEEFAFALKNMPPHLQSKPLFALFKIDPKTFFILTSNILNAHNEFLKEQPGQTHV